ncbi:MAG: YigZ family protein, partial [Candidatus Woesearchaeota archaeon]
TAGYSALRVLQQKNIVNVCVIIARTFGGVKLGTSGLMRAFATSCERALDNAHIKSFVQKKSYSVVISPKNLGGVETFCKQKGLIYFIKPILTGSDTGKLRLTCMIKQDDILIQKEFNRIINTV